MINKITSFFTHQRKNILLYFEEDKSESISLEITPEKTISQLYIENINQISAIKAKIFLKKKNYLSNNQQRKEYCFLLINKNDQNIRIRLKNQNIPWKNLIGNKNAGNSLFYILNDNYYYSYTNNGIICRLNNLIQNKSQNEPKNNKPLSEQTRIINFVSPENKIIDGEIEKYSYNDKTFKKKFIYLDSNKLIYKSAPSTYQKLFNYNSNSPYNESNYINNSNEDIYNTENLWNVIPLSIINSVDKNTLNDLEQLNIDIKKFGERLFVIRTIKNEKLILRFQNNYVRDKWFEIIRDIVEQVKIDKYFYRYNNEINEGIKNLYLIKMKFIYKLLNIKGILSLKEGRKIFFESYDNQVLKKIIEFCVEFKLNNIKKNIFKSYEQIKNLVEFLGIENFEEDTIFTEKYKSSNELFQDLSIYQNKTNEIKNPGKLDEENLGYIDKKYVLKNLLDEETHSKLTNIYQSIRKRSLSFKEGPSNLSFNRKLRISNISVVIEDNLLDNLFKNITKNYLSKEHKKIMKNNSSKFFSKLNKINAIQFCKINNFNIYKMNVLNEEEKEDNIIPDVFSDLDEFL